MFPVEYHACTICKMKIPIAILKKVIECMYLEYNIAML